MSKMALPHLLLRFLVFLKVVAFASAEHDCDEFFNHMSIISKAAGTRDARKVTGFSPAVCKMVFSSIQKKTPQALDHVANLAAFLQVKDGASFSADEMVPDVRKLGDCPDYEYGQGNPGPGSEASAIAKCENPTSDECPHDPCVPEYLQTDTILPCNDPQEFACFDTTKTYQELEPGYGGGALYPFFTVLLEFPALGLVTAPFDGIWSGCDRDRTNAGPVGSLLITLIAFLNAILITETACDAIPDDFEIFFFDAPNAVRVACAIAIGVFKLVQLPLSTLMEQVDFQDGLVDGAEVEAAYEHTRNLLTKQCATFDQAICRCAEELGYGHGCDGIDSDCDDLVDECDEDIVPPEIIVHDTLGLCGSSDVWFSSVANAEKCVDSTVGVQDDCQTVTYTVTGGEPDQDCIAPVLIQAEDACERNSSEVVPVQVDGTAPQVECDFAGDPAKEISFTGSGVLKNTGLNYQASDNCGKPLNVTVDVYSNEIEDFNAQEMALFYQTEGLLNGQAGLYVASGICSTESNGQCIKDDKAYDARRYTVVVSATDEAGNSASTECTYTILPKGNPKNKDIDFTDSTQRFLLTSYSTIYDTYDVNDQGAIGDKEVIIEPQVGALKEKIDDGYIHVQSKSSASSVPTMVSNLLLSGLMAFWYAWN